MSSLEDLLSSLDVLDREIFDSIVSEINEDGSDSKVSKLNSELGKIKKEIDEINLERQRISQLSKKCDRFINVIDGYIKKNKNEKNLELYCLKILLHSLLKDLRDDILMKKPERLLETKFDIKQEIANRVLRNQVITQLLRNQDG